MKRLKKSILPPLIAAIYWLWSKTWRLQIFEDPAFSEQLKKSRVAFAFWHGDEMVVLRLGPVYRCAAMTSTSDDGELMTRVLKWFGFGISRGSSTRGGARALIGMIKLIRLGYCATVAVDGPKGPRHKAKPGILHLAQKAQVPIIPTGVAREKALVFEKSWNKTYIPWPFSKVVVSFGKPFYVVDELNEAQSEVYLKELESALRFQQQEAQDLLEKKK